MSADCNVDMAEFIELIELSCDVSLFVKAFNVSVNDDIYQYEINLKNPNLHFQYLIYLMN